MANRQSNRASLGLPLGLEAPVMTPNGVTFLFFPTELLLTTFWDTVGYKLPEFAAGHLGIAVSENRSVVISL